jgi:uncharacterized lipoprotein NlpE involved in copper resistance
MKHCLYIFICSFLISCSNNNVDELENNTFQTDKGEINPQTADDSATVKNSSATAIVTQNTNNAVPELPKENVAVKHYVESVTPKNSISLFGRYTGVLPCVDCIGIVAKLDFKENNLYELSVFYQNKSTKAIQSKGVWQWVDDYTIELVNEQNIVNKFFVAKNKIHQLSANGSRVKGKTEDRFWLKKQGT